jgi:hypothetical protein
MNDPKGLKKEGRGGLTEIGAEKLETQIAN